MDCKFTEEEAKDFASQAGLKIKLELGLRDIEFDKEYGKVTFNRRKNRKKNKK